MKNLFTSILIFICFTLFGQEKPQIFGKNIISTGAMDFNASFTNDMSKVYFSVTSPYWSPIVICSSTLVKGKWQNPKIESFSGEYLDTDPFLYNNKRLYFISDRPVSDTVSYEKWDYKIWYTNLKNNEWQEPILLEGPFNELDGTPLYPSLSGNKNIYFTYSKKGEPNKLCVSRWENNQYSEPEVLNFVKDDVKYIDSFVSKNEEFIIFSSIMEGGYGGIDLWISFNRDGIWQEPINLGPNVNSEKNDGQPSLSPDNKTLYYSYGGINNIPKKKYLSYKELNNDILGPQNGFLDIYHITLPIEELKN